MKKLLVLTAVVMLTAATAGCQCDWFRRGALYPAAMPEMTACDPCDPCLPQNPCDPGQPGPYAASPGMVMPGPYAAPPGMVMPGPVSPAP